MSELRVGLLTLIALSVLATLSLQIKPLHLFSGEQGEIVARFASVEGLTPKASVLVAGVKVGRVRAINLRDGQAFVTIALDQPVQITQGTQAHVRGGGLVGERYVVLTVPLDAPVLAQGATIEGRQEPSMGQVMEQVSDIARDVKSVTEGLRAALGGEEGADRVQRFMDNLDAVSASLKHILSDDEAQLRGASKDLATVLDALARDLPDTVADTKRAMGGLREVMDQRQGDLSGAITALRSAAERIDRLAKQVEEGDGSAARFIRDPSLFDEVRDAAASIKRVSQALEGTDGALGLLINDAETADRLGGTLEKVDNMVGKVDAFRTTIDFHDEYLLRDQVSRGYFGLRFQPRDDRFYRVELVSDGQVRASHDPNHRLYGRGFGSNDLKFSLQFGWSVDGLEPRIGIKENTFGMGLDWYLANGIALTSDLYDMDGVYSGSTKPHFKIAARYRFWDERLFVAAGGDNLLDTAVRSPYVGAGLVFSDEDFKYLLGQVF
ncbi:MAG: hypothetical protein COX57_05480 [Alphaproteobacteria bacterium CG_4_10_14_0_2_um_filter_63_37]|nr:MAG: hypothetical protein AUJ55_12400 [Proteobacteria bacterium CG1_02_64_396]PJA25014.1 MAG: hypothetical protein COX57_05480 [Alphaproteobacteria bacterium CG_4_10_14_0_2_um_filter_63_37]